MDWYHFTSIELFEDIVRCEGLLSFYEQLKHQLKESFSPARQGEIEAIVESTIKKDKIEDPREHFRRKYIWYTSKSDHEGGHRGNDVVFHFDLDRRPNKHACLVLPKLSLEEVIDIGVTQPHERKLNQILTSYHDGKYENVPIYIKPLKKDFRV